MVVYRLTGSIVIEYTHGIFEAETLIRNMTIESLAEEGLKEEYKPAEYGELFDIVRDSIEKRIVIKYILPPPLRMIYTIVGVTRYIARAFKAWRINRRLCVEILDAAAVSSSVLTGDFASAGNIMFLLGLGGKLEEWTYERSKADLSHSLELKVKTVWIVEGDRRYEKPFTKVEKGDLVEVASGSVIPVDGTVVRGAAAVNQSSFTGEPIPVDKFAGSSVFAGTVVEEGNIVIETSNAFNKSRLSAIIDMIADSEQSKSASQKRAETLADKLVKYSFIGSALTYLITRDVEKAKSFLMVDFSCALKLAVPIAVMSAMKQATDMNALVKGGKYFEKLAEADTIIFDKTGTLTKAVPKVEAIVPFHGFSKEEVLTIAACLEEHFPHSIANAIVNYAEEQGVHHRGERHTSPEYIVAHGIAAEVGGKRACIGSEHFIFEDEHVRAEAEDIERIGKLKESYSCLYLSIDGRLSAVFGIHDPIREGTEQIVGRLRALGITKMVMLTGDSENAARYVAEQLQFDDYRSQMLPEEKAEYVRREQAAGRKVIMIGDGINDSVALSSADVGVSMYLGADIAREISGVAINSDDLGVLADVIAIAKKLRVRIDGNYRKIIGFNAALIGLGLSGAMTNTGTSFLHNSFTVLTSASNMKAYKIGDREIAPSGDRIESEERIESRV